MGRPSSVERLEPEIRDMIGRLRDRGRTLDEILDVLRPLDVDVSRSGLHRYLKSQAKLGERLRHSRAVAEVLVRRDGEETQSRIAAANIELVQSFLFGLLEKVEEAEEAEATAAEGEERPVSIVAGPKELHAMAKSLDHLASASRKNQDFIAEAEKRASAKARRAALEEAAEKVSSTAREAGLSAAAAAQLRREVLGLRTPAPGAKA